MSIFLKIFMKLFGMIRKPFYNELKKYEIQQLSSSQRQAVIQLMGEKKMKIKDSSRTGE